MAVVLTLICAVSGFALSLVNDVTKGKIEYAQLQKVAGALKQVLPAYDNDPIADRISIELGKDHRGRTQILTVFPAKKGGQTVGAALPSTAPGYAGPITLVLGINTESKELSGIYIADQSETIGPAQKALDPATPEYEKFTEQFKGKSAENELASDDFDAISGATYSTAGVKDAINKGIKMFTEHQDKILKQGS